MTSDRNYPAGTREALFVLSRGQCYEPQCRTPVMRRKDGRWQTTAHVAHICGLNEGSARFDESMPVPERNSFGNLLLLCKPHHTEVDSKALENKFPKEMLIKWKTAREGDYADDLLDLGPVTESMLKGWMTEAIGDTRDEIASAFDRLQDVSSDFLASLKQVALDFFDLPYLGPEDIKSLQYTATVFQHIPDYADQLSNSAHDLRHLPDTAELLTYITPQFRNLPDTAELLTTITGELRQLPDTAEILYGAARVIRDAGLDEFVRYAAGIQSSVGNLNEASSDLSRAADAITPLTRAAKAIGEASARFERAAAAGRARTSWAWQAFWWGAGACAVFVVAVLALWSYVLARK
jgi:hypothetical protein